jgi:hypothetical protein
MNEFTMQGLSDKQMREVNTCRIYLQAFYISDIKDLAGKSKEDWARQGKRQANRTSKWNWPVQQRPPASAWKIGNLHSKASHQKMAFLKTFWTMGRYQKHAPVHIMESERRCNEAIHKQ